MPPPRPRSASTLERSKRLQEEEAARDAKRVSDRIDATLEAERNVYKKFKRVYKILLLGQSESGKSTTLKNFQLIYTPQVFNQERESWRGVILLNVVRSIRLILAVVDEARAVEERDKLERAAEAPGPDDASETPTESTTLSFITDEHRRLMLRLASLEQVEEILRARLSSATRMSPIDETSDYPEAFVHSRSGWHGPLRQLDPSENDGEPGVPIRRGGVNVNDPDDPVHVIHLCREDMIELWADQSIRQLLRLKRLRLREMPGFFLDDLERVTDLSYIPSDDDVIRARLKSIGVSEYQFIMDSSIGDPPTLWRIFDVGGSRTQRQAWTPFFDDCNAIIFLAPISAFDEVLAEDHSVNRLEDSILLWKSVCSNKLLARCEMMLFLNKCDILKVKLKAGVKIQKYIRSYRDRENSIEVAAKYFREKFHAIQREYSPEKRSFFCHMTAVTDTRATAVILARVREAIMRSNLESLALA